MCTHGRPGASTGTNCLEAGGRGSIHFLPFRSRASAQARGAAGISVSPLQDPRDTSRTGVLVPRLGRLGLNLEERVLVAASGETLSYQAQGTLSQIPVLRSKMNV